MPFSQCTVLIAVIITLHSAAAAAGVAAPSAKSKPPPASAAPAVTAFRRPGRSPIDSKPWAVPSRPPPPNQPKSFCAPWPKKRRPIVTRAIRRKRPTKESLSLSRRPKPGLRRLDTTPTSQTWPPTGDGTPVLIVLEPELAVHGRLLIPADERRDDGNEGQPVQQQLGPAQEERLPDDRRRHGQIHRIAHVPVEAAHDESLGRSDGRGRPEAFHNKARERVQEDDDPGREQKRAQHL